MGWQDYINSDSLGAAASGGAAGAGLGSVIPGVGTLIGGAAGAGLGLLGSWLDKGSKPGDEQNRELMALAQEAKGRQFTPAEMSSFRNDQIRHLANVRALSEGRGPSLATEMLRQNTAQASANQMAMAQGARGPGGLAARNAMNAAAGITADAAGQAAMARQAEQLGALQQLGLGIYGARSADEQMNTFNARTALEAMAHNDQTRLMALQQSLGAQQAAAMAPTLTDKLTAGMAGLGQTLTLAKQGKADAAAAKQAEQQQRDQQQAEQIAKAMGGGASYGNQGNTPLYMPGSGPSGAQTVAAAQEAARREAEIRRRQQAVQQTSAAGAGAVPRVY